MKTPFLVNCATTSSGKIGFCTCNTCSVNEGDCDASDECDNGLVCGSNNCPVSFGFDSEVDCCTLPGLCTTFSELFLLCIEFDKLQV